MDVYHNSTLDCYDNPPFYQPGTDVILLCSAQQAADTVTYLWSSTASNSFVNGTSSSISDMMLTSADNGTHTCIATDGDENVGSVSIDIVIKGRSLQ